MSSIRSKNSYPKLGRRVFIAMSGGVDSSVATLLLKRQGYDVTGVHLRCYNLDGCAERDAEDARRVAGHLGIPFYVFDFEEEYQRDVVGYLVRGYREGITPNPDVMCNKRIKFGLFLERALALGADGIATGHYVVRRQVPVSSHRASIRSSGESRPALSPRRLRRMSEAEPVGAPRAAAQQEPAAWGLFAAKDTNKDQSYFLWTLTQEQLRHCLFPIGGYLKSEVRALAREAGLPTAAKKDSQGICFLGKVPLDGFLKRHIPPKRGTILTTTGERVGEHDGAWYRTIGQRHGLGIGGGTPFYVTGKDVVANRVTVANRPDHPALYRSEVELTGIHFVAGVPPAKVMQVFARVRYRQPLAPATLTPAGTGGARLTFDEPQRFVAPGQSAVCYGPDGELLGGGVIC